jgi:DNA polymerase I-like protein with 3'-5' exonuclease and polymerase domains
MWKYDPAYVKEMMSDDFDPHIDLAEFAGKMSKDDAHGFRQGIEAYTENKALKAIRKTYKSVNYAAVYGAGGPTVARTAGVPEHEGYTLVEAYWKRNWAVNAIAEECTVKNIKGQLWLYNPVSQLWYSLRYQKDRFSTLNQGTGVYCFDTWVKHCLSKNVPIIGQMHDEIIACIRKGKRDKATKVLKWAINEVNKELKLNRDLDVDVQFGNTYADIH